MANPNLTQLQRKVMKWLGHGWYSEQGAGSSVMVNGQRLCSSRTLHSLQKKGLVEQADRNGKPASQWRATQAGRDLTTQLGL